MQHKFFVRHLISCCFSWNKCRFGNLCRTWTGACFQLLPNKFDTTMIPCQNVFPVSILVDNLCWFYLLLLFVCIYVSWNIGTFLLLLSCTLLFAGKRRPHSVRVKTEIDSPLIYVWFVCLVFQQKPPASAVLSYTWSLVHIMLWASRGSAVCS